MLSELQARIKAESTTEGTLPVITLDKVRTLAQEFNLTPREVEIAALETRVLPLRYHRSLGTVGWEGQIKLLKSRVAVVGGGGLGGFVIEALARTGIGTLVFIEGDVFEETNLNRQLLGCEADLGLSKVEAAKRRVAQINSAVTVIGYPEPATPENLPRFLEGVDVLVDALDRLPTRLMVQRVCQSLGIPMVHGAIGGMIGQVMTIFPGDPGLVALYGEDPPPQGIEVEYGCPAPTPMLIGAWQVQEVLKLLLGIGEPLRNRLLFVDAAAGITEVMKIRP